ncbi:hypothetical protein DFJ74DRAFT_666456 [Hyaloraphidium curvatum]|nr:hypothetical protein DFJ74DRAFT_666456 [Hyaloraphidium curvatum]
MLGSSTAPGACDPAGEPSGWVLPPELLFAVMCALSARRCHLTLLRTALASKACHALAEPALLRSLDVVPMRFSAEVLLGLTPRAARHTRELVLPAQRSPAHRAALISLLKNCLPSIRRLSLRADSPSCAPLVKLLPSAARLAFLDLDLHPDGVPSFNGATFPPSLLAVRLFFPPGTDARLPPLLRSLSRAPNLRDLHALFLDPARAKLAKLPSLARKLRSACVHWKSLAALAGLAPGMERLAVLRADAAGPGIWELLEPFAGTRKITLFGVSTNVLLLAALGGLFPSGLATLVATDPLPSLASSDLVLVPSMFSRGSLPRIVMDVGPLSAEAWETPGGRAEREAWSAAPRVEWKGRGPAAGMGW